MKAQILKKELKNQGISIKDISIRKVNCGYSTAFEVVISDPNIDKDQVEKILSKYESYERDEFTGEILQGGNTYILVSYDYDAFDKVIADNLEEAKSLLVKSKSNNGCGLDVGGIALLFYSKKDNQTFLCKDGYLVRNIYNAEQLSKYIFTLKRFGKVIG